MSYIHLFQQAVTASAAATIDNGRVREIVEEYLPRLIEVSVPLFRGASPKKVVPEVVKLFDQAGRSVGEPFKSSHAKVIAKALHDVASVASECAMLFDEVAEARAQHESEAVH